VTLTRSVVLVLSGEVVKYFSLPNQSYPSGWSNTQFSYWARRAEAIAVLGQYDDRLRGVGTALERRLHGKIDPDTPPHPEQEISSLHHTSLFDHEDKYHGITGKGLDVIIDDVKKRTGASQFLRGKHSSLDPFGSSITDTQDGKSGVPLAGVFNTTFQAVEYAHSPPPLARPSYPKAQQRKSRGACKSKSSHSAEIFDPDTLNVHDVSFPASNSHPRNKEQCQSPSSSITSIISSRSITTGIQPDMPSHRPHRMTDRKSLQANNPKGRLPVSNSRSDTTSSKRRCSPLYKPDSGSPKKKMRLAI
jgi:hypothetical protein